MASSRKRLLARGVVFGYGALFTQIFYSLASIPLALSHLNKTEFGIWGLIISLTSYLSIFEFGMTNAFNRHLFECRDCKEDGRYGRLFIACLLSLGLAGLVVLVAGLLLTWFANAFYPIPADLDRTFVWTMVAMAFINAGAMATRTLGSPIYIHQRHDLIQISKTFQFIWMYLTLWSGFRAGWGLWTLPAANAVSLLWGVSYNVFWCNRLAFYPPEGTWRKPHRSELRSVLRFSGGLFTMSMGRRLAGGLPRLLLPRLLGLEAMAVWTVCTRPFSILWEATHRPAEYSMPMLCEMYVKDERRRMAHRWTHVMQLILAFSICVFCVCAANIHTFIALWVGPEMAWGAANDWPYAIYLTMAAALSIIISVAGFNKKFGKTIYAPYLDAALTAINTLWMTRLWGLPGLLVACIISQISFQFWLGLRYLASISGCSLAWLLKEGILRTLWVLPLAAAAAWACAKLHVLLPGYAGLLLAAACGTLLSGSLVLLLGVSPPVRREMIQMLLKPLGKFGAQRRENRGAS